MDQRIVAAKQEVKAAKQEYHGATTDKFVKEMAKKEWEAAVEGLLGAEVYLASLQKKAANLPPCLQQQQGESRFVSHSRFLFVLI